MVFERNYYSSSPVLVLPPLAPHSFGMDPTNSPYSNPSPFSQPSAGISIPNQPQPCTPSAAGRKRCRDESNLDDDGYFSTPIPEPEPISEEGWEYGEGMTLVRPNGYIIDASSQTGTWAEDKIPTPPIGTPIDRPILRTFKSQRLDLTANEDEASLPYGSLAAQSPPKSSLEPTVDDFTIHLGIGWSRISTDEDIQAAARGWAKYIENHFPVSNPDIRLQSKGLSSYLVETKEGWFLFADDLKQGRLVSMTLEKTFDNLRVQPPIFDSSEILEAAAATPMADDSERLTMNDALQQTLANASPSTNGHSVEVEMDIS